MLQSKLKVAVMTFAALVLSSAFASAQDRVRYATDGYAMGALAIIAAEKGFLQDEGIEPIIQTYSYGIDTVDAVLAGNADFGVVIGFPLLTRFAAGNIMSPGISAEPLPGWHKLYVNADLELPDDLKGKRIGVATGTAQEFVTREHVKQLGLSPDDDTELVDFTSLFEIVGAMKAGRLDYAWIWGEGVATIDADAAWKFIDDDSIVSQTVTAPIVVLKDFYRDNRDLVVRTLRAYQKAAEFMNSDIDGAANLLAERIGGDEPQIRNVISQQRYGLTFGPSSMSSLKAKYEFLLAADKIEPYDFLAQFDASALVEAVPDVEVDAMLE